MSDFDSPYACEYTYAKSAEGKNLFARILLAVLYVTFVGGFFGLCYYTRMIPLFAVCPIFLWMLIFFTWRCVSYDYYFELRTGVLTLGRLAVRKKREVRAAKYSVTLKDASAIYSIPAGEVKFSSSSRVFDFSGTKHSENRIAILSNRGGKDEICILESTRPLCKLIISYNKSAELTELMNRL